MKKSIILLLVAGHFAFTSCSNDDDSAKTETTVVGTWELESTNPPIPGLNPDACPDRPEITFNADGTADWTFYSEDNNCEAQNSSGSWTQISASMYSITIPAYGTFDGTVEFDSAQKIFFSTSYQVDATTSIPVQFTFVK